MDYKNILKWIKNNRKLLIVSSIMIVVTVLVIPLLVNGLLTSSISAPFINNTTNSDWLGFWGSYLGAIFGGIATLLGVKLTIDKMDEQKKLEVVPIIMPIKQKYVIKRCKNTGEKSYYIKEFHDEKEIKEYNALPVIEKELKFADFNYPHITMKNLSEQKALEVKFYWKKYTGENDEWYNGFIINCDDIRTFSEIQNTSEDRVALEQKDILLSNESEHKILLYEEIKQYIISVIDLINKRLIENPNCNLNKLFNVPIGKVDIASKNVIGMVVHNNYNMIMKITDAVSKDGYYDVFYMNLEYCYLGTEVEKSNVQKFK